MIKKCIVGIVALATMLTASAQQMAHGFLMGDYNGRYGFVDFRTSAPCGMQITHRTSIYDYMPSAMEKVGNTLYASALKYDALGMLLQYGFGIIEPSTYKFKPIKLADGNDGGQRIADMTYDNTTHTMYALAEDKVNEDGELKLTTTSLHIVDLNTGKLTKVGSAGQLTAIDGYNRRVETILLTLACNSRGELYAMSDLRQFYKIDKYTGKATQIGKQHGNVIYNLFQSMAFSPDDKLYHARARWHDVLDSVNVSTGIPTPIDTIARENANISGLYFDGKPYTGNHPRALLSLEATPDAAEHHTVHLNWLLPTKNEDGSAVGTIRHIRIYRLGYAEPIAVLSGDVLNYTDEHCDDGISTYEVQTETDGGLSAPATVAVRHGYDQLCMVDTVICSNPDNGKYVTISWTSVKKTVHGGYADFDHIGYNVYRLDGKGYEQIAREIADTVYKDTLTVPGRYMYVVEPVSGGVKGIGASNASIVTFIDGKVHEIPYNTGFEPTDDTNEWLIINNHTNTSLGWRIGASKSQAFKGRYAMAHGWGKSEPLHDWLISPALHIEAGQYQLAYMRKAQSWGQIGYKVLLGTAQRDTATFRKELQKVEDFKGSGKWEKVTTYFTVDTEGVYYLGLFATTKDVADFLIDSITVSKKEATGVHQLNTGRKITTVIYDLNGRRLNENSLSALKPGLYVVVTTDEKGQRVVRKFVKQ